MRSHVKVDDAFAGAAIAPVSMEEQSANSSLLDLVRRSIRTCLQDVRQSMPMKGADVVGRARRMIRIK